MDKSSALPAPCRVSRGVARCCRKQDICSASLLLRRHDERLPAQSGAAAPVPPPALRGIRRPSRGPSCQGSLSVRGHPARSVNTRLTTRKSTATFFNLFLVASQAHPRIGPSPRCRHNVSSPPVAFSLLAHAEAAQETPERPAAGPAPAPAPPAPDPPAPDPPSQPSPGPLEEDQELAVELGAAVDEGLEVGRALERGPA